MVITLAELKKKVCNKKNWLCNNITLFKFYLLAIECHFHDTYPSVPYGVEGRDGDKSNHQVTQANK